MAIVYVHTNTVTGKHYVGYTIKTIENRWKKHVYNALYNMTSGGDGMPSPSSETRQRLRVASLASVTPEIRQMHSEATRKPVAQYTADGEMIAAFPSITAATQATNSAIGCISAVARGKRKQHHGFMWKFTDKETSK